jgi:hypothetical protein
MQKLVVNCSIHFKTTIVSLLLGLGVFLTFTDWLYGADRSKRLNETEIPVVRISFGEGIPRDLNLGTVEWRVLDAKGAGIASGIGNSIYEYVFETPGEYKVFLKTEQEGSHDSQLACNHLHYPEEILVRVSSWRMNYMLDELKLSSEIISNANSNDIDILVPVEVQSYANEPISIDLLDAQSHGIGSNIVAIPERRSMVVSSGTYLLKYNLEGSASQRDAILMFDFIDNNGKVQCYTHMAPVK